MRRCKRWLLIAARGFDAYLVFAAPISAICNADCWEMQIFPRRNMDILALKNGLPFSGQTTLNRQTMLGADLSPRKRRSVSPLKKTYGSVREAADARIRDANDENISVDSS